MTTVIEAGGIRSDSRTFTGSSGRHRAQMLLLMLGADLLGFCAAGAVIYGVNLYFKIFKFDMGDLKYLLIFALCMILFVNSRLYPGVGISPVTEIKLVTQYVSMGFGVGIVVVAVIQSHWTQNQFAFLLMWALTIAFVLGMRWSVRMAASKLWLWGEPVVVIGRAQDVARTIRYFMERRRLGFVPVLAAIDGTQGQTAPCPVPVMPFSTLLRLEAEAFPEDGIETALVDAPSISEFFRSDEAKTLLHSFRRLILVSDLDWIEGASMQIHDFEGRIGIAMQKNSLSPVDALMKRALDIAGALALAAVSLPVAAAAILWIKLDTPGRIFYRQWRVGKDGRQITILKFRTMVIDADKALHAYLDTHPEAREEWESTQKLRDDPRITRSGKWLRMFSIDEIPQFWNVLRGDLSLVGARPIVEAEIRHYGDDIGVYKNMRPGITGLWQVSGRSDTTYADRVRYDTYYVRNWSVWLDLYVLLRTVYVVLKRDGAY